MASMMRELAQTLRSALHDLPASDWLELSRSRLVELTGAVTETLAGSAWSEPSQAIVGYGEAADQVVVAADCQAAGWAGVNGWLTGPAGDGQPAGDGSWDAALAKPPRCEGPQLQWIAAFVFAASRTIDPNVFGDAAARVGQVHLSVTGVLSGTSNPGARVALQAFGQEQQTLVGAQELVASANRSLSVYLHAAIGQAVAAAVPDAALTTRGGPDRGVWAPPEQKRTYGHPINGAYEAYAQQRAARLSGRTHGEPLIGLEYFVEQDGRKRLSGHGCHGIT